MPDDEADSYPYLLPDVLRWRLATARRYLVAHRLGVWIVAGSLVLGGLLYWVLADVMPVLTQLNNG